MPQGGGRRLVFQAPHWLVAMSTPSAAASWGGIKSHPHCRVRFLKRSNSMRQTKTRVKPWPHLVPSYHTAPLQQKFLLSAYSWIEIRRPELNASASYWKVTASKYGKVYCLFGPSLLKPLLVVVRGTSAKFGLHMGNMKFNECVSRWMCIICVFFCTSYVIKYTRDNRKSW